MNRILFSGRFGTRVLLGLIALGAALLLSACSDDSSGTATPFSLGGGSQIIGFTPTPTASTGRAPPVDTPTEQPTTSPDVTPATTTPRSPGLQVFLQSGCVACHTIAGVEGAIGQIGPELTNVASQAGSRVPGLSAEQYLRQSVLEPASFVVDGFAPLMTPGLVAEGPDLDALIEYLLTLQ